MSFSVQLDEFSYKRLMDEINRRDELFKNGYCTYCERRFGEFPICKEKLRHFGIEK